MRSYGGLKSQDVKKFRFAFLRKRPLTVKFPKSIPKVFIATPIDVLCSNFVKFGGRKFGEIVRCLPDKNKISPSPLAVTTARIAPIIYQGQPLEMCPECSRFHPNRFAFGGVIAERVNTAKTRRNLSESNIRLKPSFEPNNHSRHNVANANDVGSWAWIGWDVFTSLSLFRCFS